MHQHWVEKTISIIEDDLTMAVQNPALLSCVADKTLNLNYMLYMDGVNVGGAAFARTAGERSTWAITAQYVDYGELKETTEENIETGTFSAKDISISGIYTYDLSDYWSGGVRTNFIYSHYDKYSSFAIGVDLGLNYYHQESDFFRLRSLHATWEDSLKLLRNGMRNYQLMYNWDSANDCHMLRSGFPLPYMTSHTGVPQPQRQTISERNC